MEKSDSCQYLQTAQYLVSCKQRAMPVLDSWYRAEGWRGIGIVQPQSWDQVSANYQLWSNASTEPVQISVLAWYRCPVPRQYQWATSSQVTFRNRAGSRPCLCQYYDSTVSVLTILQRHWRRTKPVVNFHLGNWLFQIDKTRHFDNFQPIDTKLLLNKRFLNYLVDYLQFLRLVENCANLNF